MGTARMEAFSDGVMAVAITIMVLELEPPQGTSPNDLWRLAPKFMGYLLSFVYIGIYWSNHHQLMQATGEVNGAVLWANLHLLFWLALVPFTTAWMGEHHLAPWPTATYGAVLLMSAVAWAILQAAIIRMQRSRPLVARAVGRDAKGKLSAVLYVAGIALSFAWPPAAAGIYALVALLWLVPDKRFGRALMQHETP